MSNAHHNSEASTSAFLLGSTISQQNSKYKAYASAVDKALKSFESTTEWADLIAALVKLGKVFSSHAKSFNDIPNSLTVSKRLSQCLHPALPSGVHVKALDTYRQVFLILGRTQNLAKYLFLYAAGLFPLMDHCGIKVKSELLSIFEQFLLPLGPDLRSALPGLITAFLLALEEGTEFYGRAFNLLDQLIDKVGSDAFYICFWQAVSGNPSARLPALIFVNAKVEKRKTASSDDLLMTICGGGQASDHMLKALCAVADDTGSPLIQRHLLDFLCSALPIDSDWIPPSKLVQLLRRCLFVVLRRDMSLNRRLYQWLLNRSNDMAFAGLPVDGKEDSLDLAFFKRHTLPLVKAAIYDYLQSDSVEIVPTIGAGTLRYGTMRKTAQTQFPEVRVCRLLHYMLDRPELGQVVLEESLADLLETFCKKDEKLLRKFQTECEEIDPTFGNYWDLQCAGNAESKGTAEKEQIERAEEIRKNFNALLNSLEPSFIWNYFEKFFTGLSQSGKGGFESESGSLQEEMDENEKSDFLTPVEKMTSNQKRFRNLFPVMILYTIQNLQLDSHGDIRGRHLPRLLQNILSGIDIRQNGGRGDAAFSFDNLIALVAICRRLLAEINQNNVSIVFESIHDNVEGSPSKKNVKCNKELTEEQKLVELSLEACLQLFASLCEWYGESREQQKIGLLTAISIFVRDFADYPFYSLQALTALTNPHSPCKSLTDSIYASSSNRQHHQPNKNRFEWLKSLINVIDPSSWRTTADAFDFDMRSRLFDLFLYLCVRSVSMIEQHAAVLGRMQSQKSSSHYSMVDDKKTTTTVLLKPFLSEADLDQIEKSELFKKSASVLWERFSESTELDRLQNVCLLLLRLHSRRINDSSSDVENLIVAELTSANKMISGEAARKFRELWVFCRSSQIEEVYSGIPLKPMNRVVMLLIGFIADDSLNSEQVELRALAHSWFQDCARNNDLHKILQMLTLILLNPTTARVSIQFVQMRQRITSEQLPSLPEGANCISLATVSGKQTFNHVCKDVDAAQKQQSPFHQNGNSWSDYSYINCDPKANWVGELNRQLLLPSNNTATFSQQKSSGIDTKSMENDVANPSDKNPSAIRKTHNRTLSDIPQFDTDAESVDSFSLDTSLDQEVVDVLQYIVDTVCQPEEEDGEQKMVDKSTNISSTSDKQELNAERSFANNDEVFGQTNKMDSARDRCASAAQEADEISVVGSLITSNAAAAALPKLSTYGSGDTIKRIRTGHRRQDSLQESIFSTGTQELRLFDPTELPNSTCPGDYKQPLLDETFSHMLFYAESPSMVDLNRAEKLFRTIDTLLKSGIVGRQIVSCMLFTNISPLQSHRERASICGVSASVSQQLMDFMARHYRHIQGEGFWEVPNEKEENGGGDSVAENKNQQKFSTLFEIFSTVILYFFRSYFLNSPTNYVSEADLVIAWKCKIAALDCFAELLRILDGIIRDASSKEFATFVQHIYRQTKAQKVVLTLMLAAVPTPQNKGWKMPLTMDIAEFNSGPQRNNSNFRDLIYAYHRSLLNLASSLVILENSLLIGIRYFNSQNSYGIHGNFGVHHHQITENQINYNSSQNRSTIREARYSVVELRLFLGVVLNALKRCPERHELWLQFLIGILPYLDRALSTFVVHVTEQICRNLYDCIFINSPTTVDYFQTLNSPTPINVAFIMDHPKSPMHFVDYRIATRHNNENNNFGGSPMISPRGIIKYPANYILILTESLMSILHFSTLDNNLSFLVSPQMLARNSATSFSSYAQQLGGSRGNRPPSPNRNAVTVATSSTHSGSAFSSSNMTSMVGSAISVIPGTGLINNLFGRVFTSAENSMNPSSNSRNEQTGKTLEWLEAQRELLKRLPSMLAILSDIWAFVVSNVCGGNCNSTNASNSSFGTYRAISTLVLDILNPIAKKQKNTLINSLGIVWMFRSSNNHSMEHSTGKIADHSQCSFAYSPQQTNIAKLALRLKALSLNSIILCVNETLKEASSNKTRSGFLDKQNGVAYNLDVSLLELLHECTRQVSVTELKDSWSALSILFNESPLAQLPARASFLEFMILVDFVRRCGSQTVVEDRQISKAILDVSQKLIDAINSIVGWQLESTTWLKRTLVVRQDATNQKAMPDLSPVLDQKTTMSSTGLSASALPSEANSIRGSTISLSGVPPSRLSAPLDIQSTSSGIDMKKNASSLRSSLKDHHGAGAGNNKKDPTDSTQAIFLMAENLTELIDSVTRSEDKEKLLPTLQAVWNNTLPYLKSKSAKNVRSFLASSQLLASMSSFNYMRSVWKKNAMELLWDNAFFKMDIHALKHWLIMIDNLMTNDKTSFKELLTRITTSTTTTLSTLITSKEQEYEMRSQYLKRLAFVVLSSDSDQYNGQLNEIQERLTENLRLCQMPVIHTQVFTCYRVLLIRMSPNSFVSIWPSMITELVQVLSQMELHIHAANTSTIDEQKSAKDEQQMQLFLAACKLLETLCTLPSGYVAQFQMCRWAFVASMSAKSMSDVFVPYAVRLNRLLSIRYGQLTMDDLALHSVSLFNVKTLTSLQETHPLFFSLAQQNNQLGAISTLQNGQLSPTSDYRENGELSGDEQPHSLDGTLPLKSAIARIEHSLYVDFAEHWQL